MSRRTAMLVIGILISAIALYFAVSDIDGQQLWAALKQARLVYSIPFLALLLTFYALKLFRWQILLAVPPKRPTRSALIGPMTIGFAANNLLPFRVGELIRIILASKSTGISNAAVLGSLVIERLFDLIAILLLGALSLTGFTARKGGLPFEAHFASVALATLTLIFLAALYSDQLLRFCKFLLGPLPTRVQNYLGARFDSIEPVLGAVRSPWQIIQILANSLLQWAVLGLTVLLACLAVDIHIPLAGAVYVMILITIGISLPSTPGFVGVIEYCFVLALSAFGVPAEQALAAAIFYHALTWLSITVVGTVFLRKTALSWNTVRDTANAQ